MIACDVHHNFNRLSDLLPWVDPGHLDADGYGYCALLPYPNRPPLARAGTPRRSPRPLANGPEANDELVRQKLVLHSYQIGVLSYWPATASTPGASI
jgi:hypothetical protein